MARRTKEKWKILSNALEDRTRDTIPKKEQEAHFYADKWTGKQYFYVSYGSWISKLQKTPGVVVEKYGRSHSGLIIWVKGHFNGAKISIRGKTRSTDVSTGEPSITANCED